MSDSTQKVGKLNETIELKRVDAERETETLLGKHQEDLTSFQERIDEKVSTSCVHVLCGLMFRRYDTVEGLRQ